MKNEIISLENLDLYPLNSEELSLWLNDVSTLEKEIKCLYNGYKITEELRDYIYSQLIIGLSEPEENWIWYTYWFIVRKTDNIIIGTLSFKGKPNLNGEIEIGYALNKEYENHGYMTEALTGLCQWIKQFPFCSNFCLFFCSLFDIDNFLIIVKLCHIIKFVFL